MTTIRLAAQPDLIAIAQFDEFAGNRTAEIEMRSMLVCEIENQIVGYISWDTQGLVGNQYITYLCIHVNFRRQGCARMLLEAALLNLENKRTFISTEADNMEMLALLESLGWDAVGEIKGANTDNISELYFSRN